MKWLRKEVMHILLMNSVKTTVDYQRKIATTQIHGKMQTPKVLRSDSRKNYFTSQIHGKMHHKPGIMA